MGTPLVWFLWAVSFFVQSWSVDLSSLEFPASKVIPQIIKPHSAKPRSKLEFWQHWLGRPRGSCKHSSVLLFTKQRYLMGKWETEPFCCLQYQQRRVLLILLAQEIVSRGVFGTGRRIKNPQNRWQICPGPCPPSVKNSALKCQRARYRFMKSWFVRRLWFTHQLLVPEKSGFSFFNEINPVFEEFWIIWSQNCKKRLPLTKSWPGFLTYYCFHYPV